MNTSSIKDFLVIPYDKLEELNLEAKKKALARVDSDELKAYYMDFLKKQKSIKAVTVAFSDLEGRMHMLDYDKKYLLASGDGLTFDGSSIRGFSVVQESDLKLEVDWTSFRFLPSDVFGPGKILVFAFIKNRDGSCHSSDMRARLKDLTDRLWNTNKTIANVSVEIEGFLFDGVNAEQNYVSRKGFQLVSDGGYFHALPMDALRLFIDAFGEAQRAMGFQNEKDHPEVAPSQFELNYEYCDALIAADQIQMYKLLARQIARTMGKTASFLPKPVAGINGSGMHTNLSLARNNKNLFFDAKGEDKLSGTALDFVDRLLNSANDLCLILNPSVNAYRRLDPHYEAPNQIKASAVDRTSMVRIPFGNEKTARLEVRSVAPDINPYMSILALLEIGLNGPMTETLNSETRKSRARFLPDSIDDAMRHFKGSECMQNLLGEDVHAKYLALKKISANRCPRELGSIVKTGEIVFHHEVTNQWIWSKF